MDRKDYLRRLRALPSAAFDQLVFSLGFPAGIVSPNTIPTAQRAIELIQLLESQDRLDALSRELTEIGGEGISVPAASVRPLPAAPPCYGRDQLLDDVVSALCTPQPQPIAIVGSPGIGKSCVALAVLHEQRIAERFGEHRLFVRCDAAQSGAELMSAIALEMQMPPGADPARWAPATLAQRPTLLVLDNLETPWERDRAGTNDVLQDLRRAPELALVVTLRGGERPFRSNWGGTWEIPRLDPAAAREMFLAVAGSSLKDDEDLDDLLRAVDHVPLAVELLACRAEGCSSLEPIREAWETRRTAFLRDGPGGERSNDLGVSIDLSIESPRMTASARRLLSLLAQLPAGMSDEMIRIVPADLLETKVPLEKTRLAFVEGGRLKMLAPIREHVAGRRASDPEDWVRLVDYCFTIAHTFGPRVGRDGGDDANLRLKLEIDNLEAIIRRSLSAPDRPRAVAAAISLKSFYRYSGIGTLTLFDDAEAAARRAGEIVAAAGVIQARAEIALARSQLDAAERDYRGAMTLRRQSAPDRLADGHALIGLGHVARYRSQPEGSKERYEEALSIARELGDRRLLAHSLKSLGHAALARHAAEEARARYGEALALFRELGDELCEAANCTRSLGLAFAALGRFDDAARLLDEARPMFRRFGDIRGAADCDRATACLAIRRQELDAAGADYDRAIAQYHQVQDRRGEAVSLIERARLRKKRREFDQARLGYERALELLKGMPSRMSIGLAHAGLAELAPTPDQRRHHADEATRSWTAIPRPDLIERLQARLDAGAA